MADRKIKRALISVYDKTGIVDFARALVDEFGIEIISTGGTAKLLNESGIPVTLVEDITGWGEMLDGRVKTLHPKIHAAILADRDNPKHMQQLAEAGIEPIDMVVVNLYPFEKTVADPNCKFEDAIEMIDIGGPCLLRAAAKNHRHVLVVYAEHLYRWVIDQLRSCDNEAKRADFMQLCAYYGYWTTSRYDSRVASWLDGVDKAAAGIPPRHDLHLEPRMALRYGENAHQTATLEDVEEYSPHATWWATSERSPHPQFPMSFNNVLDASSALVLCQDITHSDPSERQHACVLVKHNNSCGVGVAGEPVEAYRRAYLGDPNAAMGGVLACNFVVTHSFAEAMMESFSRWGKIAGAGAFFVEMILAIDFEEGAYDHIRTSKKWGERVRLLDVGGMGKPWERIPFELRTIAGGVLMQTPDVIGLNEDEWMVVTKRGPTSAELDDLRLAWLIAKHTKSNAISICKDGMLIGNGAGQMSRVMSCRIATWLANENGHADKLRGSAAASDAFFPFRDGPDLLIDAGVTAIIQPGGSKRDADTIAACDERGVAMIFTGTRHFRH